MSAASSRPQNIGDVIAFLLRDTDPPSWPADAFAVAASLLKQSGAYTEITQNWPPARFRTLERWQEQAVRVRTQWRSRFNRGNESPPRQIARWWRTIADASALPVAEIRERPDLIEALIGVVAGADQTCYGVGILEANQDAFDDYAIFLLTLRNTLCERVDPSRAVVLPKLHNPLDGTTLRSLTHNLAFWDRPEVQPIWSQLTLPSLSTDMKMLVLPWPLAVNPGAISEVRNGTGQQMPGRFGHFTYTASKTPGLAARVKMILQQAVSLVGNVDAVVFPELSLSPADFERVRRVLGERILIAGVGSAASPSAVGENNAAVGVASDFGGFYHQSKHHRWRLDRAQLRQYGIGVGFSDCDSWWEAIRLMPRRCAFFAAKDWLTFCVLICEDLARQDPVAELVRCVGPNLVVALLMDGPQIPERWSARYATVLADDPRSSVLSLTCAGLVDLARSQYGGGPRSVGLWKDAFSSARQLALEPGAEGLVLTLQSEMRTEWTLDGRHDDGSTGYLLLRGVHQVYPTA